MSDEDNPNTPQVSDEAGLIAVRRGKLARLRELGVDPFGGRFDTTAAPGDLKAGFAEGLAVKVAGRILALRDMGKSAFFVIGDIQGRIQGFIGKNEVDERTWEIWKLLDRGDWVGIEGETFLTKRGEPTVRARAITVLCKALRPMPDKWHGLADRELKYRHRHLDLLANEESAAVFLLRSRMITAIRRFLAGRGFVEVETVRDLEGRDRVSLGRIP